MSDVYEWFDAFDVLAWRQAGGQVASKPVAAQPKPRQTPGAYEQSFKAPDFDDRALKLLFALVDAAGAERVREAMSREGFTKLRQVPILGQLAFVKQLEAALTGTKL